MSALFELPEVAEPDVAVEPAATLKVTEADMIRRLVKRYTFVSAGANRYATAAWVPNVPASPSRVCDFMALDCWRSGRYDFHGHEVKVGRSDWLKELRDPSKADTFRPYCAYWWLVDPHLCSDCALDILDGRALDPAGERFRECQRAAPEPASELCAECLDGGDAA